MESLVKIENQPKNIQKLIEKFGIQIPKIREIRTQNSPKVD